MARRRGLSGGPASALFALIQLERCERALFAWLDRGGPFPIAAVVADFPKDRALSSVIT